MIRSLRRLAAVLLVLVLALMLNLTWVQFVDAGDLRNQNGNSRTLLREYSRERGPILLGSTAIAQSIPTSDQLKFLRTYPSGPRYAPVTGFYSLVYGATGLERTENSILSGSDDRFFVDRLEQLFAGRNVQGWRSPGDAERQGPAGRVRRSRRPYRCGRRDRPADRGRPRARHVALVRPEQAQRPRHHRDPRPRTRRTTPTPPSR